MLTKLILGIFLFALNSYATSIVDTTKTTEEVKAANQRNLPSDNTTISIKQTYDAPTNETDSNKWNAKDWTNQMGKNDRSNLINAKSLFKESDLTSKAMDGNPNVMTSESLKTEPTIKIWDSELQDSLIANTTGSGSNKKIAINSTVKCYITRDMPIRYKCGFNGLVVSKNIDSSGLEAKSSCEENCYDQMPCVGLNANPTVQTIDIPDLNLDSQDMIEISTSKEISSDVKLDRITYDVEVTLKDGSKLLDINVSGYVSISIFDFTREEPVLSDVKMDKGIQSKNISINKPVDKIKLTVKRISKDVFIKLKNIKAIYKPNEKYICPDQQDISKINQKDYAYKCPSGNIVSVTAGGSSYKICADYGLKGDNRDGTFSDRQSCNAICKRQFSCTLDVKITDTNVLEDFREGCIQGQEACTSNKDICKDLRLNGAKVLNENVFNARQEVTNTVINSVQVQGVERPKVLLREDLAYQTRIAEEWKDEGYKDMINKSNYKISSNNLNEDNAASNAYSYGIDLVGADGIPIRSLYWVLKPATLDVNSDSKYFYSILEVVVEKYSYSALGTKIKVKDKILYLKTDKDNDYFKSFARIKDYSQNVYVNNAYQETLNPIAKWEYKNFTSGINAWVSISPTQTAEYFLNEKIDLDTPFKRIRVVNNVKNIMFALEGIVKKRINVGPYYSDIYTGSFDGSGETIGKYTEYVLYSSKPLSYQDILTAMQDGRIKPIYDNLNPNLYTKNVTNDNGDVDSNINTYLYGNVNQKKAFVRIIPKQNELNKKGFLYIFAY